MIKEDYLNELNGKFSELAEKCGVPIGELRIDHEYCALCSVEFPYDMACEYWDQITAIEDELEKFVGVDEVYDPSRDDGICKGQGRRMGITVKDGRWYVGPIDKAIEDEEDRMDSDPEYRAKKLEEQRAEMRKHWRENLIPIPPPPKNATDEAYLTLSYEYYDMIKTGEKTTEFREYSPFWVKRLLSHPIKTVRFQRGYGGPGHPPPEQMVWTVKKISLYEYDAKIECEPGRTDIPILPDFIAIDLGERVDGTNADTPHEEPVVKGECTPVDDSPLTLVDIGEVKTIVGVRDPNCEEPDVTGYVEARGERGSVWFYLLHATSRGRIETDHGRLWTMPLIVMIEKFYNEKRDTLRIGEVVELPSIEESLEIAKELGFDDLKRLSPNKTGSDDKITWVDARGLPTTEPEWFRKSAERLGWRVSKRGVRKTIEFVQPACGFSPVSKGASGEFYTDVRDYLGNDDEFGCHGYPCIIFPDLEPGLVEVPQEAAKQILEGRTATKLDVVALRDCEKAGDPVVIEIEDEESAPNSDQDGSSGKIEVVLGDITQFDGDAIVNAANERMLGGGGVDGAIHRAAGPQLLRECEKMPEVRPGVRCPTGEARITAGGDLKAKYVIHTVGPVYRDGKQGEPESLASCYLNSLQLAADNGIRSIAFPSISTGVYGYPVEAAAAIAVREVRAFLAVHPEMSVTFVCFNGPRDKMDVKAVYERLLADDLQGEHAQQGDGIEESVTLKVTGESQSAWDPHGNVTAFMDAGETYELVCVEPATADRSAVIEARGSKGTVKFTFKYGREGHDVRCRVVGKNAVLRSPSLEFLHLELNEGQAKCLRKGDVIKVPSTMNGLVWIRDNYKCPLGNGREIRSLAGFASELAHRWIDVNGAVISEPAWTHTLLAFKLLYGYQNWTRQNGGGCRGYDEFTLVKLVLDAYAKILTEENALDFEGGFEDLELACDTIRHAAKSINRHVKKGDFKPNQEKIYEFDRLVSVDQLRRLSAKSDFATELLRCAEQVNHSRANGFREMVDVVREYSPLRYPNTRVRIEPL